MRNAIEWGNYWWEDASDYKKERYLLVGDSVARSFRSNLSILSGEDIAVDCIASSSYVDDVLLEKEIELFLSFEEYYHSVAIINLGFHHGLERSVRCNMADRDLFRKSYLRIIRQLQKQVERILLVSGTHHVISNRIAEMDEEINREIEARNEVVFELSEKYHLEFIDLYHFFHERHTCFPHKDYVHFVESADELMAGIVFYEGILKTKENFSSLNFQKLFFNVCTDCKKKIILFGGGVNAKLFLSSQIKSDVIFAVVDNCEELWGKTLVQGNFNIKISSPEILRKIQKDDFKVVICTKYYLKIIYQLNNMGYREYSVYDPSRV